MSLPVAKKVACLTGDDIAALLEGQKVTVDDVEFVYDGLGLDKIEQSLENFKTEKSKGKPSK